MAPEGVACELIIGHVDGPFKGLGCSVESADLGVPFSVPRIPPVVRRASRFLAPLNLVSLPTGYLAGQCQPYGEGKSKAYKNGGSDNVSAHHGQLAAIAAGAKLTVVR